MALTKIFNRFGFLLIVAVCGISLSGMVFAQDTAVPTDLWEDQTETTIGTTGDWTNKVEVADINGDGWVDILFANGGNYSTPGQPTLNTVFLNQGADKMFTDVSETIFGGEKMLTRVLKVRDVNNDGNPDIMIGTTYQTQSRLYLGDGTGKFTDATTDLPQINASVGDLEFGDVDNDGDLDIVLADWGADDPMNALSKGGRTMLWLNDGAGHFTDVTSQQMPDSLVKFSWELEFVDVDNDYDLDILVSCKWCIGSFLFENDGTGHFTDVSKGRLPQFANNYEFEAMDINGDTYLDLVTINDGSITDEHMFLNDQKGGFETATEDLWSIKANPRADDNVIFFLDFDSDGDADFVIGSLDNQDRLLINDGKGKLTLANQVFKIARKTSGTLYMETADLNHDGKLDVVDAQGEAADPDKVYFGKNIASDTAPPIITLVEQMDTAKPDSPLQIRARIHDNKSPTMPHDWKSVSMRWTSNGETHDNPMVWYGEYLWRATVDNLPAGDVSYQVCATDAAGNEACSEVQAVKVG